MVRKLTTMILACSLFVGVFCAQAADTQSKGTSVAQNQKSKLVTEGEFARWLVNVLGLKRTLPAAPTAGECFAVLMQNGIAPKAGWNSTNLVTMGTLARVVVQALHSEGEVQNPDDDNSYIQYLKSIGIEFGTIGQAMDVLGPVDPSYSGEAAVVSTDPLKKQARVRPLGDEQFGTDLQPISPSVVIASSNMIQRVIEQVPVTPTKPPPMTPTGHNRPGLFSNLRP